MLFQPLFIFMFYVHLVFILTFICVLFSFCFFHKRLPANWLYQFLLFSAVNENVNMINERVLVKHCTDITEGKSDQGKDINKVKTSTFFSSI